MISLELFSYAIYNETDMKITEYVNKNLSEIIRVLLDYLNADPDYGMDGFFPRDYLTRKPNECRNHVDELYEIIISPVRRDSIHPKYEYLLYSILQWWEESSDESEELIPIPLPDDLRASIINDPSYMPDDLFIYILEELQNYESYYYFCFFDHDFLPSELSKMIIIYSRNPKMFAALFPDVDLNQYLDLMPVDLRNRFIEVNLEEEKTIDNKNDIELSIVMEVYNALRRFQRRVVEFQKRSESEICNDLCDSLAEPLRSKYNLQVTREFPIGRAAKRIGETDLFIYGSDFPTIDYTIIEAKDIMRFQSEFKQLLGYLNHNFQFGITISINKAYRLDETAQKIIEYLNTFKDSDFSLKSINDTEIPNIFKSVHTIPEDINKEMPIYHIIFHLNDTARERIAKEARPKK